jgi:hypothetical protein
MNHLTDELLNEYLDRELADRAQVDDHIAVCADCAARLAALQALFTELDSLPEVALTKSLAARFLPDPGLPALLPRSLRLTVILQAVAAIVAMIVAAPFVTDFLSPYFTELRWPSFAETLVQIQIQWTTWLAALSRIQLPTMPEIPVVELSSIVIMLILAGVSMLWLVGNGLLLRNQIK